MQTDSNRYRLTAIIFSLCIPAFGLAQEDTTDEERQPDPEAAATDAAVTE